MTSVRTIVSDALRESGIITIGESPQADEHAEGLARLNALVQSVLGNEMGEELETLPLGSNGINTPTGYPWYGNSLPDLVYVPSNSRVVLNLTDSTVLNLHPAPHDGARFAIVDTSNNLATYNAVVNGNGRLIEAGASLTLNTNGLAREWFYRADLGDWRRVATLTDNDDLPFPVAFDDMFIVLLAMRLNPRYGAALDPASQAALNRSRSQFRARYSQPTQVDSETGLIRLTHRQGEYYQTDPVRASDRFDRGWY